MRFFAVCYGCVALCLDVSYYVSRYAVLPRTCRTMCTGMMCYPLHSTWDSRGCVPLTSRHLLCVYVSRVLRLLPLCMNVPYYVYQYTVLLIALYLRFAGVYASWFCDRTFESTSWFCSRALQSLFELSYIMLSIKMTG